MGEMRKCIEEPDLARSLNAMSVDVQGLKDSTVVFKEHGVNGQVTKEGFLNVILNMRSSNPAKVKDHILTRQLVHTWISNAVAQIVCDYGPPQMANGARAS